MWLAAAWLSALFSCIGNLMAKKSVDDVDSAVITLVRTLVIFLFAWMMAILAGTAGDMFSIDHRSMFFLCLSGISNGVCWLALYKAMSLGPVDLITAIEKSSIVLTIFTAIFLFNEKEFLAGRIILSVLILVGMILMYERTSQAILTGECLFYGIISGIFAYLNTIFSKIGIAGVESNLGTAINTTVVLAVVIIIVLLQHKWKTLFSMSRHTLAITILSGIATAINWSTYYYAIKFGPMSVVVPVNKMSLPMLILYAHVFQKEKASRRVMTGLLLITASTLILAMLS